MIELNKFTKHDFLDIELATELNNHLENTDDATYFIIGRNHNGRMDYYIVTKGELAMSPVTFIKPIPTYTLSQLIYKLDEWPKFKNANFEEVSGPLDFLKDAPFYLWNYSEYKDNKRQGSYLTGMDYNPLNAAARCLIRCIKNNVSYNKCILGKYDE